MSSLSAALFILMGMATLGFSDNLLALIVDDSSLWQFHLMRSAMVLVMLFCAAALGYGLIRPKRWGAVAARSFIQGIALLIYFGCVAIMPIGVVVAGFFTAPLFVAIIGRVFQGKRIGPLHALAIGLGFLGALLVIRPDTSSLDWVSFLPILGGFFYAVGAVATRAWCEGEGTFALSAGFFLALGIFGAVGAILLPADPAADFSLRGWMPMDGGVLFWLAVQSVGAVIGIACIFRGYQLGEASQVAVFEYSLLVFASGWAWFLWGQAIPPLGLFGMALIITSGALIAWRGGT
ncbi:MAG: DMT family transporter [Pseudomonadota bacterium]